MLTSLRSRSCCCSFSSSYFISCFPCIPTVGRQCSSQHLTAIHTRIIHDLLPSLIVILAVFFLLRMLPVLSSCRHIWQGGSSGMAIFIIHVAFQYDQTQQQLSFSHLLLRIPIAKKAINKNPQNHLAPRRHIWATVAKIPANTCWKEGRNHRIIASQNGMDWKRVQRSSSSNSPG